MWSCIHSPYLWLIPAIFVGVILIRLYTTYPESIAFYGYDFGFYSYAITHSNLNSLSYFLGLDNNYGNWLFVIFNWIQLPQTPTLIATIYVWQGLAGLMIFLILKRYGYGLALAGVALFVLSSAQTQLHTMFLWKAAAGQLLILVGIYLIQSRQYKYVAPVMLLLAITHHTSFIIFGIALLLFATILNFRKRKNTLFALMIGATTCILLIVQLGWDYIISVFIHNTNDLVRSGIFISPLEYLRFSVPIIPFAIYGIYKNYQRHKNYIWLLLFGTSCIWIIVQLPFYNRIVLYLDIALIYFAIIGLAAIPKKSHVIIAGIALIAGSTMLWYQFIQRVTPQFSATEVHEINLFSMAHQNSFVLATSANDGPWLLANLSGNVRLAAPGLFEDHLTAEDWQLLWSDQSPENKGKVLNTFPKPLYIYERSGVIFKKPHQCLEQVSRHFYRYSCQ